ncbi:uncharacterized protein LOC133711745 [Rosa rugosa]|uniref:uncharacterized protein LOC133711745 n=1 Tax=Rosa rugosa TaxID=74645 RepID=UPI002B407923|nr:uncharacterized protein LOC133711745 [Rosa rugosa]
MLQGNILVWNCRGIVNAETQRALVDIVLAKKPTLIFLSETLAQKHTIDSITRRIGFKDSFCVPHEEDSQGLAILWTDDTHVNMRSHSPNHIDVEVGKPGSDLWRFTGIYGVAARGGRDRTWQLIETLAAQTCFLPWLMAGDFNEVWARKDKSGGPPRALAAMTKFRRTMTGCGFRDMGFVGSRFTWSNRYTKERLDRAFQTNQWRSRFPYSKVLTLSPSESDHSPLLIEAYMAPRVKRRLNRPFRFKECWFEKEECTNIVKQGWALPTTGKGLQQIGNKTKELGSRLGAWHRTEFTSQQNEMKIIQEKLRDLMRQPYSIQGYEEHRKLHVQFSQLLSTQEKYWKQRSRALWLKDGDRNTAYFHRKASNRRSRNMIFSAEPIDWEALDTVIGAVPCKVTTDMNNALMATYTDEEIKTALFQMHPSKSPGPDGMSPFFYQKYWDIVSHDVCLAVRDLLTHGEMWPESNYTYLCLIPKIKDPKEAMHFRPIALCNVICRIGSKVVANRLKVWLPEIVSPLQSAYVPGRLISDNTLVANEAAHFMHKLRNQEEGFFSLKLDISKAYDRLDWSFISAILTKLGFASQWIHIIMKCICSVTYSILLHGEPSPPITPTRGIRQGDPLSPYLFILCGEGLSALISQAVSQRTIQGLTMCPQAPTLHHLFFADDSILFGSATDEECLHYKLLLDTYERASGQKVNFQKSSVVFSNNVLEDRQHHLAAILGVQCVKEHDKYLGLPMRVGRSKSAIFAYIKEKLTKTLVNWKAKVLSSAGKEILIKAVAQTMPLYAMNCYLLPKTLCDDIHKLCASFFWGDTDDKKKIHWRSWEKLCLTKHEGGMGFKDLYAYNLAMLGKQGWRILSNPHSLIAKLYKAKYFPHCSFWEAEMGDSPSFSWRSILNGRPVLKAGVQWCIGNGTQVNIWNDKWIPNCQQYMIHKPRNCVFELVSDLIDSHTRQWIPEAVTAIFPPDVAHKVLSIPLSRRTRCDTICWSPEKRGFYSVKTAYWIARTRVLENVLVSTSSGDPFRELWKRLWSAKVPGKVQICVWRACSNLLPTRAKLLTKGYEGDLHFLLCSHPYEDTSHIFCTCPTAAAILAAPPFQFTSTILPRMDLKEWLLEQAVHLKKELFDKLLMVMWAIWRNRNNVLWNNTKQSADALVLSSLAWLDEFTKANRVAQLAPSKLQKTWRPPERGTWKLNVDGSFIPNTTLGGVGGVLRDDRGNFRAAFAIPISNVASAKQVELRAIKEGLNLVATVGNVVIETDCLDAVSSIADMQSTYLHEEGLLDDIRHELEQRSDIVVQHTSRVCNRVAHCLAISVYEVGNARVWQTQPPALIMELLKHDCKQLG